MLAGVCRGKCRVRRRPVTQRLAANARRAFERLLAIRRRGLQVAAPTFSPTEIAGHEGKVALLAVLNDALAKLGQDGDAALELACEEGEAAGAQAGPHHDRSGTMRIFKAQGP